MQKSALQNPAFLGKWLVHRKEANGLEKHDELLALSEKQLLMEILLELRQNTFEVEHLQDINADIYDLVKNTAWNGY